MATINLFDASAQQIIDVEYPTPTRYWIGGVSPDSAGDDAVARVELPGLWSSDLLFFSLTAPMDYLAGDLPEIKLIADMGGGTSVDVATLLPGAPSARGAGVTGGQVFTAKVSMLDDTVVTPATIYLLQAQYSGAQAVARLGQIVFRLIARSSGLSLGGAGSNGGSGVALKDVSFCTDGHTNLRNWQENVVNWAYWNEGAYYSDPNGVWSSFMAVEKVGDYGLWMFGGVVADRDALWTTANKVVSIAAGTTMFILPESHRFADERQIYVNWNAFTPLPLRIRANGEVYSKWDLRPSNDEGGFYHANQQVFRAWPLSEVGDPTA